MNILRFCLVFSAACSSSGLGTSASEKAASAQYADYCSNSVGPVTEKQAVSLPDAELCAPPDSRCIQGGGPENTTPWRCVTMGPIVNVGGGGATIEAGRPPVPPELHDQ
jgi:hypothetical protein